MKKQRFSAILLALAFIFGMISPAGEAKAANYISMMRLYNPATHEHLHTADANERRFLTTEQKWNDEGYSWNAPVKSNTPVYRLFNQWSGEHFYTCDANERRVLISNGWNDEGIGWYSDDAAGVPVYRVFNAAAGIGSHHYTTDYNEYRTLTTQRGWTDEGIAWYGMNVQGAPSNPTPAPAPAPTPNPAPTKEETKKRHEIVSVEYSTKVIHSGIAYTIQLKNPNTGYVISDPDCEYTVRDNAGRVLKTGSLYVPHIMPGEVVTYTGTIFLPDTDTIGSVEFTTVKPYDWDFETSLADYAYQNELSVENTHVQKNEYYTTYTGEVKNNSDIDLDSARVTVVFKKDGKICYADYTYVEDLVKGGKKAFEIMTDSDLSFDSYSFELFPW